MNDDLCLEVVSWSCHPLCYIRHWISQKQLKIEAWFQRTTNRKCHMVYQMVTWPMTSRDSKRCCEAVRSAILATAWLLVKSMTTDLMRHFCAPVCLPDNLYCVGSIHSLTVQPSLSSDCNLMLCFAQCMMRTSRKISAVKHRDISVVFLCHCRRLVRTYRPNSSFSSWVIFQPYQPV